MSKHVLITGGSRGLGRALAIKFHQTGANVTVLGRTKNDLKSLVDELGGRISYQLCDLAKSGEIEIAAEEAAKTFGPVQILINNAGVGTYKPFLEQHPDDMKKVIDVNFTGLMRLTHIIASQMKAEGGGQIVNIASDLGRRPLANMAVYVATKHALVGFSHSLARELKADNIKCMVLTPGIIDTFFDGRQKGAINAPNALQTDQLAEVVHYMTQQPDFILIDELSIHPLYQDF